MKQQASQSTFHQNKNQRQSKRYNNNSLQLPVLKNTKLSAEKSINNINITINLANTHYEVLEYISNNLNWKVDYSDGKLWDCKWYDGSISAEIMMKMNMHQKINHFPGMSTLARKNNLAYNLNRMKQYSFKQYDFFPKTYLLPQDMTQLRKYNHYCIKKNIFNTYIVKPQANCQGRGIYLTQDIIDIDLYQKCVVQEYINNPLTYKGLKFDLRIYALVSSLDPLKIYIYNQGLTRFATETYQQPSSNNLDNLCMHLTNYAINKQNPKYIFNTSMENLSLGHKNSLAQFFTTLKTINRKPQHYWAQIKNIIVKTLISGLPHLRHQYKIAQNNPLITDMCFQILGFDFMISDDDRCYLLEVNHSPSFGISTPLDKLIKSSLIQDTLELINLTSETKQLKFQIDKLYRRDKISRYKSRMNVQDQRKRYLNEMLKRQENYQNNHRGNFSRIYPNINYDKQKLYEQLIAYSLQSFGYSFKKNRKRTQFPAYVHTNQSRMLTSPQQYSSKYINKKYYGLNKSKMTEKININKNNYYQKDKNNSTKQLLRQSNRQRIEDYMLKKKQIENEENGSGRTYKMNKIIKQFKNILID